MLSLSLQSAGLQRSLLWAGIAFQLIMIVLALLADELRLVAVPVVLVALVYGTIVSTTQLYVLLFALIPFSMEVEIGGIGLDFPTELLLIYITAWMALMLIRDYHEIRLTRWGFLLLLFLGWGWISTVLAQYPILSAKFMLAKLWYVIPFYYGAHYGIRHITDLDRVMRILVRSVAVIGLYTFIKHGLDGWTFDRRMYAGAPFMRNHVNYACILLMVLPVCRYLYQRTGRRWYWLLTLVLLFFSYFAYARIVYLSLAVAIIGVYVLRARLLAPMIAIGMVISIGGVTYMLSSDHLVEMAPDYTSTISHVHFDDMLSATYDGHDISTMERLYRWVAGLEMARERPIFGFGPSNFYSCYRDYTINSFQTYVSDNPERSGIHSYYLMMLVEQGVIGLLLFLLLLLGALLYAQRIYHRCDPTQRSLIELIVAWLLLIATISLLNDMIEVIKVGPFFFLSGFVLFSFLPHMVENDDA